MHDAEVLTQAVIETFAELSDGELHPVPQTG